MSVESPYGYRTINVQYGDICNSRDDVLVVSTHANPRRPLSGAVIQALSERFGLVLDEITPLVGVGGIAGTYDAHHKNQSPFKRVLLLRIPGAHSTLTRGVDPLTIYQDAIWSVYGSLAALELQGHSYASASLPLLGGQRHYPTQEAIETILALTIRWLKTSRSMHVINLYAFEGQQATDWSNAMDTVLGRCSIEAAKNQVVQAVIDEILSGFSTSENLNDFRDVTTPIENSLRSEKLCLQQVAAFGRALVERIVQSISIDKGLKSKGKLFHDIESLREGGIVAPWIAGHFHNFRVLGNETLHPRDEIAYKPKALDKEDLLPVLVSLLRILTFWNEWK